MNIQALSNAFQPMTPAVELHNKPASVPSPDMQSAVPLVKPAEQSEIKDKQSESKKSATGEQEKSGSITSDELFADTQLKIATSPEGVTTIKIVDSRTHEVINEIPPEKLAKILSEIRKLSGLIFNQKA